MCISADWNPWPIYDFKQDDVLYRIISIEDSTVEICGFDFDWKENLTKEITVPDLVIYNSKSYRVIGMGDVILQWKDSDTGEIDSKPWVTQFYNWQYPVYLTLPSTLQYMNENAFYYCYDLRSVYFNDCPLEKIAGASFCLTGGLETLHLPNNVKEIGSYAFNLSSIYEINFPEGLNKIEKYAFTGGYATYDWDYTEGPCNLDNIVLPNSLVEIGSHSFFQTPYAKNIVLSNNLKEIPDTNFNESHRVKEIIIPNSVSKIGNGCFTLTTDFADDHPRITDPFQLESITLGRNLKTIGEDAFGEIPYLKTIYCLSDNPPTFVFDKANPSATIYVPKYKKNVYKNDSKWGTHFSNFLELPDILIQFQLKDYTLKIGESLPLRYIVTLFNTNISISENWESSSTDGLSVTDGIVYAHKCGDYIVKYTITDSQSQIYEASCNVTVEEGSKVDIVYDENKEIDFSSQYEIYDINGSQFVSKISTLPHGVYIIRQGIKSKKIIK